MLFRVKGKDTVCVTIDGADVFLDPTRDYDDSDPADAAVIDAARRFFYAPNVDTVERATKAPGEKRTTKR